MDLRSMLPVGIVLCLGAGAAWVEYGQYSSLMLSTASGDVAQLCASLADVHECPEKLSLSSRPALDPWSRAYVCRAVEDGILIYTLGADGVAGGEQRDSDIACASSPSESEARSRDACVCRVGGGAVALVR
jgi:hypothetical protein